MSKTIVKCIDTNKEVGADILSRSDKVLKVALDGTTLALTLYKRTAGDKLYVGNSSGLEFSSTGE